MEPHTLRFKAALIGYLEYDASANTDDGSCAYVLLAMQIAFDGRLHYAWCRSATSAGLRRTCVRRCMLMARQYS